MNALMYYQNEAKKFACNKYNFKIEEAIMSEPLSKKLGMPDDWIIGDTIDIKYLDQRNLDADDLAKIILIAEYVGYNRAIKDLDQLSPDVNELSNIIRKVDGNHSLGADELAQEIINKMPLWIKK